MAHGTIKATVLIETILAAFEMDEILYELRDHSAGLNAGRWDYIFSVIKKLGHRPEMVLPDRGAVTMAVPFMRSYCELLVKTCHRRGAFAMGGMAAFIPSRRDAEVNAVALAKVREDKEREASQGFDGTWVAHPDLVPTAYEAFDAVLGDRPNQIDRQRDDVTVTAADLLNVAATPGEATEDGLRNNVSVGIQYLAAWLQGSGAVAINNLMEDAATAEISRSQIWQWLHHDRFTADDVGADHRRGDGAARARLRRGPRDLREHRHAARLRGVPHPPGLRPADGGRGRGRLNPIARSLSSRARRRRSPHRRGAAPRASTCTAAPTSFSDGGGIPPRSWRNTVSRRESKPGATSRPMTGLRW